MVGFPRITGDRVRFPKVDVKQANAADAGLHQLATSLNCGTAEQNADGRELSGCSPVRSASIGSIYVRWRSISAACALSITDFWRTVHPAIESGRR